MNVAVGKGAARRELAIIVALASVGVALVSLVAFTPWYDPSTSTDLSSIAVQSRDLALNALASLRR
jgi:hypothetical protein